MSGCLTVFAHTCYGVGFAFSLVVFFKAFLQGPCSFTDVKLLTVIAGDLIEYARFLDGGCFVLWVYQVSRMELRGLWIV